MKKLVIYDHNGQQQFQTDVFVDGQDFEWTATKPMALWLGTIKLISEKQFNEEHGIRAIMPFPKEQQVFKWEEITEEDAKEIEQHALEDAALEAKMAEIEKARDELYYKKNPTEEVIESEPETVDNQNTGDSGSGETSEHESVEGLPEEDTRGQATKGNKKPRKSKTA